MTHPAASPPTAEQVEARVRAAIMKVKRDNPGSMRDSSANELTAAVLAALAPAERAEAVPDQLTKEIDAMSEIPRRVQIEKLTPAENAIRLANEAVEALPADVRLTGAQILLGKARALVADYVDGVKSPTRAGALDAAGVSVWQWFAAWDAVEAAKTGKITSSVAVDTIIAALAAGDGGAK